MIFTSLGSILGGMANWLRCKQGRRSEFRARAGPEAATARAEGAQVCGKIEVDVVSVGRKTSTNGKLEVCTGSLSRWPVNPRVAQHADAPTGYPGDVHPCGRAHPTSFSTASMPPSSLSGKKRKAASEDKDSGSGQRPERSGAAERFYSKTEAAKYEQNSRMATTQRHLAERALHLIELKQGVPALILDVGCGTGYSGRPLEKAGHTWIGTDISENMLSAARAPTRRRDVVCADIGIGLGYRKGTFDGAVSVSAVQWLCAATRPEHDPYKRCSKFFRGLHAVLAPHARAALQIYPEEPAHMEMLKETALKAGFEGGLVIDYPTSVLPACSTTHPPTHLRTTNYVRAYCGPPGVLQEDVPRACRQASAGQATTRRQGRQGRQGWKGRKGRKGCQGRRWQGQGWRQRQGRWQRQRRRQGWQRWEGEGRRQK